MSALLLAIFLLGEPPAATASPAPASPAPPAPAASPAPDAKRDKSLGAVAKRTPPANKKAAPAKVLTNEDLDKARQGGAAVSVLAADGVSSPAGSESNPVSSELQPTDDVPRDEATWRQRGDAARMRIADADANITQAEQRLAELRSDIGGEDVMNPFRQQNREAEVKAQTETLDAARAEAAAARQAMSDLEDEARRASIPPGWLREP